MYTKINVAPRNNIEREIAQIVRVLDVSSMSIDDDFFEMGGTSLDAMVVVSKLKSNGIHITMQDVYQFKTVRYIANHTENAKHTTRSSITRSSTTITIFG